MKSERITHDNIERIDTVKIEWDETSADRNRPFAEIELREYNRQSLSLSVRTQSGFVNLAINRDAARHLARMFAAIADPPL